MRMSVEQLNKAVQVITNRQKAQKGPEQDAGFQDIVSQILSMMNMPSGEQSTQGQTRIDGMPQPAVGLNQVQLHGQNLGSILSAIYEAAESPIYNYKSETGVQPEIILNFEQLPEEEFNPVEIIRGQDAHGADLQAEADLDSVTGLTGARYSQNIATHPQAEHTTSFNNSIVDATDKKGISIMFEAEMGTSTADSSEDMDSLITINRLNLESSQDIAASRAEQANTAETDKDIGSFQTKVIRSELNMDKPQNENAGRGQSGISLIQQDTQDEKLPIDSPVYATHEEGPKDVGLSGTYDKGLIETEGAQPTSKAVINSAEKNLKQSADEVKRDKIGLEQQGAISGLQNQMPLSEIRLDSEYATSPQTALIENMRDIEIKLAEEFTVLKTQDESSLKMKLKPEQLGEMEVRLRMKDGYLSAEILVETISAREAMEGQLHNLKQRLRNHNILLNEVSVSLHQNSQELNQDGRNSFNRSNNDFQHYSGKGTGLEEQSTSKMFPQEIRGSYLTGITGNSLDLLA